MKIHQGIKEMLSIVESLHQEYPKKRFTLDGRLVGDIGEILVEEDYELILFDKQEKHHDGKTLDDRYVQIKTTMQNHLTFPADHTPEYYIGIKVYEDGTYEEVFNGPGAIARKAIENRVPTKTNLHSISLSILRKLSQEVSDNDRIPKILKN